MTNPSLLRRGLLAVVTVAALAFGTLTSVPAQAATGCMPLNKLVSNTQPGSDSYATYSDIMRSPWPCAPAKNAKQKEKDTWDTFIMQYTIAHTYAQVLDAKGRNADTEAKRVKLRGFAQRALLQELLIVAPSMPRNADSNFQEAVKNIMSANFSVTVNSVDRFAKVIAYHIAYMNHRNGQINDMYQAAEFATGEGYTGVLKLLRVGSPVGLSVYTRALDKSRGVTVAVLNRGASTFFLRNLSTVV
jgi:hypothetical protein